MSKTVNAYIGFKHKNIKYKIAKMFSEIPALTSSTSIHVAGYLIMVVKSHDLSRTSKICSV